MNTFADLQVRANEGDLNSMFALAKIIYYGDSTNNIESNRQEAFSLMRRAADGGHTEAMLATAFSFADGVGVKQDKSMAATYFLRAAESGEQGPMLNLAQLYKRGAFVEKNFVKAQYWLRRAAEIGNVQAKLELGVLFFYGAEGVARDLDEAARWLKSAADDGSVEAMRQMVLVVQPDPDAMREWLQRAADLGDAVSGKLLADQPAATKSTKSDIMSDDVAKQLRGVRVWRQLLADNESSIPPSIISLLPRLVVLLQSQNAKLQLEVAWVLTNVASGPGAATQAVIDAGAMPVLGQLVRSTSDERVREQAIWALGNIFGDSPRSRDLFLMTDGALQSLLDCFGDISRKSLVRTTAWTLSLLCRGSPPAVVVVPTLGALLRVDDSEVQADACWALVYLTSSASEPLETFAGVLIDVQPLLRHESKKVRGPALRFVSNIARGGQTHVQAIIEAQMIPMIVQTVTDAPWRAANREALAVLASATSVCTPTQVDHFAHNGVFGALLNIRDDASIAQALDCIDNMLRIGGADGNSVQDKFEECGGIARLTELATQGHRARDVLARLSQ